MAEVDKLEKKHGGKRQGSGRKAHTIEQAALQTVKQLIAGHALEEVNKKARFLNVLDTLYLEGCKGNVPAGREYLDRTLGKVAQPISGDPDNRTPIPIEISEAVARKNKIAA
jgi:hypothetical protein